MSGHCVLENDLRRIENDIITKQRNGKYMKFYKPLNMVVIMNMSKQQYLDYWLNQYHNDYEKMQIIGKACIDKFENGLTSMEDMIDLIINSKDNTKDKQDALKLLGIKEIIDK